MVYGFLNLWFIVNIFNKYFIKEKRNKHLTGSSNLQRLLPWKLGKRETESYQTPLTKPVSLKWVLCLGPRANKGEEGKNQNIHQDSSLFSSSSLVNFISFYFIYSSGLH